MTQSDFDEAVAAFDKRKPPRAPRHYRPAIREFTGRFHPLPQWAGDCGKIGSACW